MDLHLHFHLCQRSTTTQPMYLQQMSSAWKIELFKGKLLGSLGLGLLENYVQYVHSTTIVHGPYTRIVLSIAYTHFYHPSLLVALIPGIKNLRNKLYFSSRHF